jgi:hypothetical protein
MSPEPTKEFSGDNLDEVVNTTEIQHFSQRPSAILKMNFRHLFFRNSSVLTSVKILNTSQNVMRRRMYNV